MVDKWGLTTASELPTYTYYSITQSPIGSCKLTIEAEGVVEGEESLREPLFKAICETY